MTPLTTMGMQILLMISSESGGLAPSGRASRDGGNDCEGVGVTGGRTTNLIFAGGGPSGGRKRMEAVLVGAERRVMASHSLAAFLPCRLLARTSLRPLLSSLIRTHLLGCQSSRTGIKG